MNTHLPDIVFPGISLGPALDFSRMHIDTLLAGNFYRAITSIQLSVGPGKGPSGGTLCMQSSDMSQYGNDTFGDLSPGTESLPMPEIIKGSEAIDTLIAGTFGQDCIVQIPLGHVVILTNTNWHASPVDGLNNRLVVSADGYSVKDPVSL